MSGKVFEQPLRIRWNHCDPAGIVYHPQYFVMLNNAMEDFFRECAGLSYEESLVEGYGFPIAGIRCDFCAPSRCGDDCVLRMGIESIGITGEKMSLMSEMCTVCLRLPETETFKVQELTLPVYHALCAMAEATYFNK